MGVVGEIACSLQRPIRILQGLCGEEPLGIKYCDGQENRNERFVTLDLCDSLVGARRMDVF